MMDSEERPQTNDRRLTVLGLCLTFGLAVVFAQLVRYQVVQHAQLEEMATHQRVRRIEKFPERGYIADARGHLLAMNSYEWEISASPTLIEDRSALIRDLAPLLEMDPDELDQTLTPEAPWVLLDRFAPTEVGESIDALHANGIMCRPNSRRIYPAGSLTAHVIGFVNNTRDGFYGVEGYHNALIKGITGTIEIEYDSLGDRIPLPPRTLRSAKGGTSLILSLDLNIQHIAQQELRRALGQFEAESGTVIVMNPKTGAIMALVSLPVYDPNHFATADPELLADPSVSSMWEPGSIFKIITWAGGLDSGVITPDMTVFDEGKVEVGGRVIENSDRQARGEVTMTEALVHSLNTVAAYISTTMGKDRFYGYVRRFGFGDLTEVDLASEGPGILKLPGHSNWYPSDLGTNSFGQGIAVTPMQMITAVAAVANKGMLPKPRIVQYSVIADENSERNKVYEHMPEIRRQTMSAEAASALTDMLVEVVEEKATEARLPGYRIAGKTGTAQIPTPFGYHETDTIVSFVGYAPADDPEFIILVKLDRPKTSRWAQYTAAPAFRAIAERLVVYLQIPPDDIRLALSEQMP
jgi:cell division protein FtsI/penicillin-binding protein 2